MSKKSAILTLIASVILWFISAITQALVELFISGKAMYSFFGSTCNVTGYPIAICANDSSIYFYYVINVIFWFVVIFAAQKLLLKKRKK